MEDQLIRKRTENRGLGVRIGSGRLLRNQDRTGDRLETVNGNHVSPGTNLKGNKFILSSKDLVVPHGTAGREAGLRHPFLQKQIQQRPKLLEHKL